MTAFISPYLIPNNSKYSKCSTSWQHKHSTFLSIATHLSQLYHLVTRWFLCWFFMRIRDISSSPTHTSFTTQRYIQNIVKHLKRSFLRKLLTSFSLEIFSQKATSDVIDWVLDMAFKLCIILFTETQLPNFFFLGSFKSTLLRELFYLL